MKPETLPLNPECLLSPALSSTSQRRGSELAPCFRLRHMLFFSVFSKSRMVGRAVLSALQTANQLC